MAGWLAEIVELSKNRLEGASGVYKRRKNDGGGERERGSNAGRI